MKTALALLALFTATVQAEPPQGKPSTLPGIERPKDFRPNNTPTVLGLSPGTETPVTNLALLASSAHAGIPKPDRVLKLWDGKPPGDFTVPGPETLSGPKPTDKTPISRLTNVSEPRLEFYLPTAEKKNGAAVVIVPGGGFGVLASEHEGSDLALWFRERGFAAAVLQHRCPTNKLAKPWEFPAWDTQRAISLVREKAADLGVHPDRIGLFGFSAGGQVALIAATNDEARLYPAADATDKASCRPDFLMLCYAWHILADDSLTELKPEIHISEKTPPTFLAQAYDDKGSLAEGSTLAFLALRKAKVSAELHIYSTGGHGFGMRANDTQAPGDFPGRLELWLKTRGLMAK
jgi:acetyl esterase/lipase